MYLLCPLLYVVATLHTFVAAHSAASLGFVTDTDPDAFSYIFDYATTGRICMDVVTVDNSTECRAHLSLSAQAIALQNASNTEIFDIGDHSYVAVAVSGSQSIIYRWNASNAALQEFQTFGSGIGTFGFLDAGPSQQYLLASSISNDGNYTTVYLWSGEALGFTVFQVLDGSAAQSTSWMRIDSAPFIVASNNQSVDYAPGQVNVTVVYAFSDTTQQFEEYQRLNATGSLSRAFYWQNSSFIAIGAALYQWNSTTVELDLYQEFDILDIVDVAAGQWNGTAVLVFAANSTFVYAWDDASASFIYHQDLELPSPSSISLYTSTDALMLAVGSSGSPDFTSSRTYVLRWNSTVGADGFSLLQNVSTTGVSHVNMGSIGTQDWLLVSQFQNGTLDAPTPTFQSLMWPASQALSLSVNATVATFALTLPAAVDGNCMWDAFSPVLSFQQVWTTGAVSVRNAETGASTACGSDSILAPTGSSGACGSFFLLYCALNTSALLTNTGIHVWTLEAPLRQSTVSSQLDPIYVDAPLSLTSVSPIYVNGSFVRLEMKGTGLPTWAGDGLMHATLAGAACTVITGVNTFILCATSRWWQTLTLQILVGKQQLNFTQVTLLPPAVGTSLLSWGDNLEVNATAIGSIAPVVNISFIQRSLNGSPLTQVCSMATATTVDSLSCTLLLQPRWIVWVSEPVDVVLQYWDTSVFPNFKRVISLANNVTITPVQLAWLTPSALLPVVGGQRVYLSLPRRTLTQEDWTQSLLSSPLSSTISSLHVVLNNVTCTAPTYLNSHVFSCVMPSALNESMSVLAEIGGMFNASIFVSSIYALPSITQVTPASVIVPANTSTVPTSNFTFIGKDLFLGGRINRVSGIQLGPVVCTRISYINDTAGTCQVQWPAYPDAAAAVGNISATGAVSVNVSGAVNNNFVISAPSIIMSVVPVVKTVLPNVEVVSGMTLVIVAEFVRTGVEGSLPIISVSGIECSNVTALDASWNLLSCLAPALPFSTTYPVANVVVTNAVGEASINPVYITYFEDATLSWSAASNSSTEYVVWPSSFDGDMIQPLSPAPSVILTGRRGVWSCNLIVASVILPSTYALTLPRTYGTLARAVGNYSINVTLASNVSSIVVPWPNVGIFASSGATLSLAAQCVHTTGRMVMADGVLPVRVVTWSSAWVSSSSIYAVPTVVSPGNISFTVNSSSLLGTPTPSVPAGWMSCPALVTATSALLPSTQPLHTYAYSALSSQIMAANVSGTVSGNVFTLLAMDISSAALGASYYLTTECQLESTGERLRLLTRVINVSDATVALSSPLPPATLLPFTTTWISVNVSLGNPSMSLAAAAGTCMLTIVNTSSVNITTGNSSLLTYAFAPTASYATVSMPLTVNNADVTAGSISAAVTCSLWNDVRTSPAFTIQVAGFTVSAASTAASALAVYPSGLQSPDIFPALSTYLRVVSSGYDVLTCALYIVSAVCPTSVYQADGVPFGVTSQTTLSGLPVLSTHIPQGASSNVTVPFTNVGLSAASACGVTCGVTCSDVTGRSAAMPSNFTLHTVNLTATWTNTTSFLDVYPSILYASVTLSTAENISFPAAAPSTLWGCAMLLFAAGNVPVSTSIALSAYSTSAVLAGSGALSLQSDGTSVLGDFTLDARSLPLDSSYTLLTECSWRPTGERIRLAPLPVRVANVTLRISAPPGIVTTAVVAYAPWYADVTLLTSSADPAFWATAGGVCRVRVRNGTSTSLQLSAVASSIPYTIAANGTIGPVLATMEGPGQQFAAVYLTCSVWGQQVDSQTLFLRSASHVTAFVSDITTPIVLFPSGASNDTLFSITGASIPDLLVDASMSATCWLSIETFSCPAPGFLDYGHAYGAAYSPPVLAGTAILSAAVSVGATSVTIPFQNVGIRGPSGCTLLASGTCQDATGRVNSTANTVTMSTASLRSMWFSVPTLMDVVPGPLPPLSILISTLENVTIPDLPLDSLLHCVAVLLRADIGATVTNTSYLSTFGSRAEQLASASLSMFHRGAIEASWQLDATQLILGAQYNIIAECVWLPTAERMRLPPLDVNPAAVSLSLAPSVITGVIPYASINLTAQPIALQLDASTDPAIATTFWQTANGVCRLRMHNTTSPALQLSAACVTVDYAVHSDGSLSSPDIELTAEGSALETALVYLQCTVWSQTFTSNFVRITTGPYAVVFANTDITGFTALPSGISAANLFELGPSASVMAPAHVSLSCALQVVNQTNCSLIPALVGDFSVTQYVQGNQGTVTLTFPRVGLRSNGGCAVVVTATCSDGSGRQATTVVPALMRTAAFQPSWSASNPSLQAIPPTTIPSVGFSIRPDVRVMNVDNITLLSSWMCRAVILAYQPTDAYTSAYTISTDDIYSTSDAVFAVDNEVEGGMEGWFTKLDARDCGFSQQFWLHSTCIWIPTNEIVPLQSIPITIMGVNIVLHQSFPMTVRGYWNQAVTLHLQPSVANVVAPSGQCSLIMSYSTSITMRLFTTDAVLAVPFDNSTSSIAYVLQGPLRTTSSLFVRCLLWNQTVSTPLFDITTSQIRVVNVTDLPFTYLPSDGAVPWLMPAVGFAVIDENYERLLDVQCYLRALASVTGIQVSTSDFQPLVGIQVNATGILYLHTLYMLATFQESGVTLRLECERPSGDEAVALQWNVAAEHLEMVTCVPPATTAISETPLDPFSFVISRSSNPSSCTGAVAAATNGVAFQSPLPTIRCALTLLIGANSTTNVNDTNSVFLQNTELTMDPSSKLVSFESFVISAPRGQRYGLQITCTIGNVIVPTPYKFTIELEGCAPGTQPVTMYCPNCAGYEFSLGSGSINERCTTCPQLGATCTNGILHLLEDFYRPPTQAGRPFAPNSELHACKTVGACLVNAVNHTYECATGHTGPLCSICEPGYAHAGAACQVCWSRTATVAVVAVVLTILAMFVTTFALRGTRTRSDNSIAFKILMGYVQAISALTSFKSGSTRLYRSIMGPAEYATPSPISLGMVACLWDIPYVTQYIATVLMPFMFSFSVIVVFCIRETVKHIHCKPMPHFAFSAWRSDFEAWRKEMRYLTSIVAVLQLLFMPVVMASLRVLDCYEKPVDGTTYLRADFRVICGEGDHAIARIVAIGVLVILLCFVPGGLIVATTIVDPDTLIREGPFKTVFGFLYDGYRQYYKRNTAELVRTDKAQRATSMRWSSLIFKANRQDSNGSTSGAQPQGPAPKMVLCFPTNLGLFRTVWWEAVVMWRKAAIAFIAVLIHDQTVQLSLGAITLFLFTMLQLRVRPYVKKTFNVLELMCLFAESATAIACFPLTGMTLSAVPGDPLSNGEIAITALLLLTNLSTLCVVFGFWAYYQMRNYVRTARYIRAATVAYVTGVPMPVHNTVKVKIHGGNEGGTGSSKSKSSRHLNISNNAGSEETREKRVLGAPPMLAVSPDGAFSQQNPLHKLRAAALATAANKSAATVALTAFASPAMKANMLKTKSTVHAPIDDEEEDPATVRTNPSPQTLEGAGVALPGVADAADTTAGLPASKRVGMAKFKSVANAVRLSSKLVAKPTASTVVSPVQLTPTSSTPATPSSGLRSGVNSRDFVLQKPRSVAPKELSLRADEPEASSPLRSLRSTSRDFAVSSRLLTVSRPKAKTPVSSPVSPSSEVNGGADTPVAAPIGEGATTSTTPKLKRFANAVRLAGKLSKLTTPAPPVVVVSPPTPAADPTARASVASTASRTSVAQRPRSIVPSQIAARREDDEVPRASLSSMRSGSREFHVSSRMLAIHRSKPTVTPLAVGNPFCQPVPGSPASSSP